MNADCLEAMRSMGDCTFDAVVTDPPYGLSFMGAEWDSFGGSRGGTETIEERREKGRAYDGSNAVVPKFPNSHGKPVRRSDMVEFQAAMTPAFEEMLRVAKPGAHLLCFGGTRTLHRMACAIEDAGWEIRDCIMWVYGSGFPKSMDVGKAIDKELGAKRPSSEQAQWDGWGTCLKPAWEPIIVARKPLDGTVAHNVMEHGTGALNIDACRIPTGDKLGGGMRGGGSGGWDRPWMHDENKQASFVAEKMLRVEKAEEMGRFPANLVHDGSEEVLELFPQSDGQQGKVSGLEPSRIGDNGIYGHYSAGAASIPRGDSGSAARFFYCAKASAQDRGDGNDHPTVKPNELMRWLVRLVCSKDGIVLDPFCGSGSTGVACVNEGMSFVGIDQDEHYCGIARRRIEDALPHQQRLF